MDKSTLLETLVGKEAVLKTESRPKASPGSTAQLVNAAAVLKAKGLREDQIEKCLSLRPGQLATFEKTEQFFETFVEAQAELHTSYEEKLDSLSELALERQAKLLLTCEDPKTLILLTNSIIDRAKGKPKQSLEVRSLNFSQVKKVEEFDAAIEAVQERIAQLSMKRIAKE